MTLRTRKAIPRKREKPRTRRAERTARPKDSRKPGSVVLVCRNCGIEFCLKKKDAGRSAGYCTLRCYYSSKTKGKTRVCSNCGKTFSNSHALKYCSLGCFKSLQVKRRERTCIQCEGRYHSARPSEHHKYCSRKCAALAAHSITERTFNCLHCGKEVCVRLVSSRTRKFCSKDCQHAHMKDSNHPLFRGNRRQYRGANWITQSALARDRDGKLCRGCGEACGQRASVDHIVPFRLTRDFAKQDGKDPNDLNNLISLCRSCHSKKTMAERRLLKGDVIGFLNAVRVFMPIDRVEHALEYWGIMKSHNGWKPVPAKR